MSYTIIIFTLSLITKHSVKSSLHFQKIYLHFNNEQFASNRENADIQKRYIHLFCHDYDDHDDGYDKDHDVYDDHALAYFCLFV